MANELASLSQPKGNIAAEARPVRGGQVRDYGQEQGPVISKEC